MTFYEYIAAVTKRLRVYNLERAGQAYMNELGLYRPDLYNKVMDAEFGSNVDPFYNDKNLNRFLEFVGTNWEGK